MEHQAIENIFKKAQRDTGWFYHIVLANGKIVKVKGISKIEDFEGLKYLLINEDHIEDCSVLIEKTRPRSLMINLNSILAIIDEAS